MHGNRGGHPLVSLVLDRTRFTLIRGIGHDELYKMGFDGASIGQLRKLTPKQYKRLLEILEEFQTLSCINKLEPKFEREERL